MVILGPFGGHRAGQAAVTGDRRMRDSRSTGAPSWGRHCCYRPLPAFLPAPPPIRPTAGGTNSAAPSRGLLQIMKAGRGTPFTQRFDTLGPGGRTRLRPAGYPARSRSAPYGRACRRTSSRRWYQAFRRYTVASYVNSFDIVSTASASKCSRTPRAVGNGEQMVRGRDHPGSGDGHELDYVCARWLAAGRRWTCWRRRSGEPGGGAASDFRRWSTAAARRPCGKPVTRRAGPTDFYLSLRSGLG